MTRTLLRCTAAILTCCAALSALAQAAVDRPARAWAAGCAACHGTDGRAQAPMPTLAGRDAAELTRTLLDFKSGQRPAATVMTQLAKGYTDDELQRIARVLAAGVAP